MSRMLNIALIIGLVVSLVACTTATRTGMFIPDDMVLIPAGDFMMGSPHGEGAPDQHPQHQVLLPAFYMDKYEVTVGQYKKFVEKTGYRPLFDWVSRVSPGDDYPVVGVSWFDARAYAEWAKKRLPTEAEWEYACRAGTTTKYYMGDTIEPGEANFAGVVGADGWERAAPVGSFAPNPWGLYDMYGNVFEWCYDRYDREYYKNSLYINPIGPTDIEFEYRVMRGGSWVSDPRFRGSASRLSGLPEKWGNNLGFRCVRDVR